MSEFLKNYIKDFLCGFHSLFNTLNQIETSCPTRQTERQKDRILLSVEEYKLLFIYFIGWVVLYLLIEILVKVNLKLRKDLLFKYIGPHRIFSKTVFIFKISDLRATK